MSGFNTEKYWRYKGLMGGGTVDEDRTCARCGYNLRGLSYSSNCPECGTPILVHQHSGALTNTPIGYLRSLWAGLGLALVAWVGLLATWVWLTFGLLDEAGLSLAVMGGAAAVPGVFLLTRDGPGGPIGNGRGKWSARNLARAGVIPLAGMLALCIWARASGGIAGGGYIALWTLTGFLWIAMQAAVCQHLSRIAVGFAHDRLGQTFWHLAWGLGICSVFTSAFLGAGAAASARWGTVPVCCLGGYFIVIAFLVAEVWFGVAVIVLHRLAAWSIRYRKADDGRAQQLRDRLADARERE